jgi:hypothetical protein
MKGFMYTSFGLQRLSFPVAALTAYSIHSKGPVNEVDSRFHERSFNVDNMKRRTE